MLPVLLLVVVVAATAVLGDEGTDQPSRTPSALGAQATSTGRPAGQQPPGGPHSGPPGPTVTPAAQPMPGEPLSTPARPTPSLGPAADMALVPVAGFWTPDDEISLSELRLALEGGSARYGRVIVPAEHRDQLEAALSISLAAGVESGGPSDIRRAVRQGALGLMRVTDVTPAVRALGLDGQRLFGNARVGDVADWPLRVRAGAAAGPRWRQGASWTLVAGGDIQLDRWMAYHVSTLEKGVDWPWDGGTVRITSRVCCSELGHRVPEWEPTGNEGAVRALFSEADLAMANLEAAAVNDPGFHALPRNFRRSLNFSGDPRLLDGLQNTGFDFLSLANNHIDNAGPEGIRDTRRNLRQRGIAFAGAGRDEQQAARPAELEAAGRRVVVLPCTTVGRVASADRAGSAPCAADRLLRQIREAARDADVVIVFPHWGREYRATPNASQRELALRWTEAGADLVLGAHSHWVGSIEKAGDSLVLYSMGNLAFDQPWSEPTMQGVIVELTFNGDRLVQLRLHPALIVDDVQPNLLEYDGGGDRVIQRMRDASDRLLPY